MLEREYQHIDDLHVYIAEQHVANVGSTLATRRLDNEVCLLTSAEQDYYGAHP